LNDENRYSQTSEGKNSLVTVDEYFANTI